MYKLTFYFPSNPSGESPILHELVSEDIGTMRVLHMTIKLSGGRSRLWDKEGKLWL